MNAAFETFETNLDGAPEISPEQLKANSASVELIDVRRPEEFSGELGHIAGARLVTLETEFEDELTSLDSSKTYVFVCRSGARSSRATLAAKERGFQSVFNLKGGMIRWNALSFPVTREES